jgi:hypothetical protein
MDKRESAIQAIRDAQRQIAEIAVKWQKEGIDTSPLSAPVMRIQDARAYLESLTPIWDRLKHEAQEVDAAGDGRST